MREMHIHTAREEICIRMGNQRGILAIAYTIIVQFYNPFICCICNNSRGNLIPSLDWFAEKTFLI